MGRRKRAGRPRKDGKRQPNGQLARQKDMDTVERIEMRAKAMTAIVTGGDPERLARRRKQIEAAHLSPDFPLSLMLAAGRITFAQHSAGMWLAALYHRIYGASHAAGAPWARLMMGGVSGGRSLADPDLAEARDIEAERAYGAAMAALDALPDRTLARQLVHQIAVHLRHDWFTRDALAGNDTAERHRQRWRVLRAALDALVGCREGLAAQQEANQPLATAAAVV